MISRTKLLFIILFLLQALVVNAGTQKDEIKKTVDNFYKQYISALNSFEKTHQNKGWLEGIGSWPLRHKLYFTTAFLKAYKDVIKDPDLDYDPIASSNAGPEAVITRRVFIKGSTAYAYVGKVGIDAPLSEIRLEDQNGKWLIDAIDDLNKWPTKKRK